MLISKVIDNIRSASGCPLWGTQVQVESTKKITESSGSWFRVGVRDPFTWIQVLLQHLSQSVFWSDRCNTVYTSHYIPADNILGNIYIYILKR